MIEIKAKLFHADTLKISVGSKNVKFIASVDNAGNEFVISKEELKRALE